MKSHHLYHQIFTMSTVYIVIRTITISSLYITLKSPVIQNMYVYIYIYYTSIDGHSKLYLYFFIRWCITIISYYFPEKSPWRHYNSMFSPYHITNPQEYQGNSHVSWPLPEHFPYFQNPLHHHLRHQIRGRALAVARHEGHRQRSRLRSLAVPDMAIENIDSTRLLNNV